MRLWRWAVACKLYAVCAKPEQPIFAPLWIKKTVLRTAPSGRADFIEGIRAANIDKDRSQKWAHGSISDLSGAEVDEMLMPLGVDALIWENTT